MSKGTISEGATSRPGVAAREDRAGFGIALMLLAYVLFSFIDASAKWLALAGLPALQVAFMRYAGHFVISTAIVGRDGLRGISRKHTWTIVIRGILLVLSTVMNFISLQYLPLTLTSTILFSAPIWVCLLSWPFLGERVGPWRIGAIALGFVGILVAVRPFGETFHWSALLSIFGAFCFALYGLITRRLAGEVSTNAMQFYSSAVGTLVLLPAALWLWQMPETTRDWIILLCIGFFGWGGHQLLTSAHRFATASTLSPYSYVFILYLTAWSYFLFDTTPDALTIVGAVIITIAGLVIWFREKSRKMPVSTNPPPKTI